MALNIRQTGFIAKLKECAVSIESLWKDTKCLTKCFDEEFDDEKDNALIDVDEDVDTAYNFDTANIKLAITALKNFNNFYEGNAVVQEEYGEDIRRVK